MLRPAGLFRQIAFRVVVGDEDGHGKNHSLPLADGDVTLAPLCGSLGTLLHPESSGKSEAKIGSRNSRATVDRAALLLEARAMGRSEVEAGHELDALTAGLRGCIDCLDAGLTEGWTSERVIDIVRARLSRLESGEPLGPDPDGDSPRR